MWQKGPCRCDQVKGPEGPDEGKGSREGQEGDAGQSGWQSGHEKGSSCGSWGPDPWAGPSLCGVRLACSCSWVGGRLLTEAWLCHLGSELMTW